MIIEWKHPIELSVAVDLDDGDEPEFEVDYYKKGDRCDVSIIDEDDDPEIVDLEFEDGSVACGVSRSDFLVIED